MTAESIQDAIDILSKARGPRPEPFTGIAGDTPPIDHPAAHDPSKPLGAPVQIPSVCQNRINGITHVENIPVPAPFVSAAVEHDEASLFARTEEFLANSPGKLSEGDVTTGFAVAASQWLAEYTGDFEYLLDLKVRMERTNNLSTRQVKGVLNCWRAEILRRERQATQQADEPTWLPVPELSGFVVEGEILTVKEVVSDYPGIHYKMLVKVDVEGGAMKLWGSLPSGIYTAQQGDVVRFTANILPSRNDDTFGLFKRPRKAEVVVDSSTREAVSA